VSKNKKSSRLKTTNSEMDDLLSKFGGLTKSLSQGMRVTGKIIRMSQGRVVLDIGGKSEGIVAEKAYKEAEDYIKTLKVGDTIDASVIVPETNDGFTILSLRRALEESSWGKIEKAQEQLEEVDFVVRGHSNAGLTGEAYGVNGFIPTSQLGHEAAKNPQGLIGKTIKAIIIDVDREKKRMVLSEKEVSEKEEIALKKKALEEIEEGQVFEGKVTSIYDFGCFVEISVTVRDNGKDIDIPLEGLVHISQMAWDKVEKPGDVVAVGDTVSVAVLDKTVPTGSQRIGKLALSIKQAQKDPWSEVEDHYSLDTQKTGTVTRVSEYGIFVQLEPGIEGLIHMTKVPPGRKFEVGDSVLVTIEEIDAKARKIALGLVLTEKPLNYK
jgi:small subunit ribosomal protein S1